MTPLPDGFARQALHAWRLGLIHPETGRSMQWRADVPDDMAALSAALGLGRDDERAFDDEYGEEFDSYDDADGSDDEDDASAGLPHGGDEDTDDER